MAIEQPIRRILTSRRVWVTTVLINTMIMTIYLWHITLSVVLIGLLYLTGGAGMGIEPGSLEWWLTRPVWITALAVLLMPIALLLSPLEHMSRVRCATNKSTLRQVTGAMMLYLGVALLPQFGFGGIPLPGLDIGALALVIVAAGISILSFRLDESHPANCRLKAVVRLRNKAIGSLLLV